MRPMRFPGVDNELHKILDAKMDQVSARREACESFKDIQLGIDHILFKTPCEGLKMKEDLVFQKVSIAIFPVLMGLLMMSSRFTPKSKQKTQNSILFQASSLDSLWVEQLL